MSLLGFEYFAVAAREENISRAAEKLFVSQQSLSAHIKRLEEQYGVQLFERKPSLRPCSFMWSRFSTMSGR